MFNKDTILGLTRHLLTFGGGYLVTAGLASDSDTSAAVGAVVTLVGFVWSVLSKKSAKTT